MKWVITQRVIQGFSRLSLSNVPKFLLMQETYQLSSIPLHIFVVTSVEIVFLVYTTCCLLDGAFALSTYDVDISTD